MTLIEWVLVVLSILGNVLIIYKMRSGYGVWIVGNVGWVICFTYRELWAQVFLFTVYLALAIWGFIKWKPHRQ